jgi:hypothetical protein
MLAAYGTDADRVRDLAEQDPELAVPMHPRLPYLMCEVVWAVRQEMARSVEDVLSRRTRALVLDARAALECAPVVARVIARELGRDEAWVARTRSRRSSGARGRACSPGERTDAALVGSPHRRSLHIDSREGRVQPHPCSVLEVNAPAGGPSFTEGRRRRFDADESTDVCSCCAAAAGLSRGSRAAGSSPWCEPARGSTARSPAAQPPRRIERTGDVVVEESRELQPSL